MKATFMEAPKPELTESEAIRLAQQGDAAAFEFLYRAHSKRVYNLCLRMLKNTADAEELTQQIFLRLFRKIGTFRCDARFSTWLHRVAVNAVLMHLRRKKPTDMQAAIPNVAATNHDAPAEFGASDASMLGAVERMNLLRAIRKLPAGYKRCFLLHDVMGYEHREIAELSGCTSGSSKSQLHKARRRLRRLLNGESGRAQMDGARTFKEAVL